MPSLDTKQLKAQLKEEKFERSYLIYGEEDYLFTFESLLHDVHVQQPEEAGTETKA